MWVSVRDRQVAFQPHNDNTTAPISFDGFYMDLSCSGTDYRFSIASDSVVGTFKFASDGYSVTVRFTKHFSAPEILNTDIVCNKK